MIRAALFDLDGVIRHYDPAHPAGLCRSYGLPDDAVSAIAFEAATLGAAVAERVTFEEWRDVVADEVTRRYGLDGHTIADEFFRIDAARIDGEVLSIMREVRARVPVGLLTNATSRLPLELTHFELDREVDVVCNSWELGVAKPAPAIFALAAERMGAAMSECFFTDDRLENVEAAQRAGMVTHHFTDAGGLRTAIEDALGAGPAD